MWFRLILCFVVFVLPLQAAPETPKEIAVEIIGPLLDPVKIATLKGDRPANARLYRVMGWLETARRAGGDLTDVINDAQAAAGYAGTTTALADRAALRWSWKKLDEFGCFTDAGVIKMKKGGSPQIGKGESAGDFIALDHILPRSVVPELSAKFYNLEPIPSKLNARKGARITKREVTVARRWKRQELLSSEGLLAIEARLSE